LTANRRENSVSKCEPRHDRRVASARETVQNLMVTMSSDGFKIRILIQRGKFKDAEAMTRTRLAEEPNSPDLHLLLAQVLFHLERPKEAESAARTAIGLDPGSGYPHETLAQILLGMSDLKGAEEAVRQANSLDGDCASRRGILARIASERGKYQLCLEHAQAGLEMDPEYEVCRLLRGISLGRLGRHEEADEEAMGLLRDDPEDSYNHSVRGWILLERNAMDEAKMHFQEALRLDPENEDARSGLARCLQQGNPVLGWLLRAIIALDKIPLYQMLIGATLVAFVLPRYVRGNDLPVAVAVIVQVLRVVAFSFIYVVVAVQPLFHSLLYLSREGRNALGPYELRAVKWCIIPLIAGLACLVLWAWGGAKSIPVAAIGWFCAASLLFEGLTMRHPWVRRRMLIVAGLVCASAVWFMLGPYWLLAPMASELAKQLVASTKAGKLPAELVFQLEQMIRIKNQAFVYPALAIYMLTAFSEHLVAFLTRKAPDDND